MEQPSRYAGILPGPSLLDAPRYVPSPSVQGRRTRRTGVVVQTLGVLQTGRRPTHGAMTLPHRRASEVMTHGAVPTQANALASRDQPRSTSRTTPR